MEQEFTEQVINTLPDIFYIVGGDGTLQRWNQRLPKVTGYSDEEIAEMQAIEFFVEEDQPRVAEAIEDVLETGQATVEAQVRTATGERIPHELTGGRLQDSEDNLIGLVGIGRDITDRMKYEERLKRQNEQLEAFTSVVSHDLRNPLNIAQGRLEMVREECDSEHLDGVAKAHERMEILIEDLLALAREGEEVAEMEAVDLEGLIQSCWQNVETAEATLIVDADQTIRGDKSRLAQLLENLIRNAVEHAGDDVKITVGDLDNGFYVADDGSGIPEGKREQIFESGYSTSEEGTGFGLAIVQEIVEAHNWAIRATESDSGGARFEITGVESA